MRINFFFLLFLLVLLSKCSDKVNNSEAAAVTIDHSDTITFHLNEHIAPNWTTTQYVQHKDKEYIFVNDNVNDFKIFGFELLNNHANLVKTIQLEKEGPNGIGRLQGFYFVNWDSIFTIDAYSYRLHLLDSSAKVKKRYSLIQGEIGQGTYLPTIGFYDVIYKVGHSLIIPASSDVGPYQSEYRENHSMIVYDLEEESFSYRGVEYPEKYKEGYFGIEYSYPTFIINQREDYIYNFGFVNYIIKATKGNRRETETYAANSSHVDDDISPLPSYTNQTFEITKYKLINDKYIGILNDEANQLYYRAFERKYTDDDVTKIFNREANGKNLQGGGSGYLILDRDLNVVHDYILPKGLSAKAVLTTKKGVYSKNYLYDEVEDEVKYISVFTDR